MNKEQFEDSTIDSMYETDSSNVQTTDANTTVTAAPQNPKRLSFESATDQAAAAAAQVPKKAKKSLEHSWDNSATSDMPYMIETPVSLKVFISFFFIYL